ncbi:MAG: response regulator transcription factor, partial [Eubacteriales bacterium]
LSEALCQILSEQKYMTDAVGNGEDGLAYAKSGIYDCIVLDVMLPKKNGFEIISELRKCKISTPVLMLTARDTIKDKVKGLDLGADDYMTKPFSPEELLARIRVISRRKGEVITDEISYGDFTFSLSSNELSSVSSAKSIRLNFKESELIKLFLSRPNTIFSKEELITKIWGYDSDAGDNNVEAYISFLRKKLLFIGSSCEIVSVKKLGYKLEAPDAEKA